MGTHLSQSTQARSASHGQVKDGGGSLGEEQLVLNSKQLDLLHVKVRDTSILISTEDQCKQTLDEHNLLIELRTTVQRMLEAIPTGATTPEEVHQSFVKAVANAQAEIKDFGTLYNSEETRKVLEQAKKSRDANPKGIKPWRAKDHPDWLDLAQ
ncbi:hypothetical protein F4805DRAFT_458461 [Annulohypoxylon moriforme]|nr:hypothetical protein F4805DRAFT_458461 [Annulohypoxylon moriforme]